MALKKSSIDKQDVNLPVYKKTTWVVTAVFEFDTQEEAEEYLKDIRELEASNREADNQKLLDELYAKIEDLFRYANKETRDDTLM